MRREGVRAFEAGAPARVELADAQSELASAGLTRRQVRPAQASSGRACLRSGAKAGHLKRQRQRVSLAPNRERDAF